MRWHIEPSSGVPITRQIADQIRAACAGGALRPGDCLPSVRELARDLAVNQNTILRVYERLTAEGLLTRRHGAGTFVSASATAAQKKAQLRTLRDELARLIRRARTLNVSSVELRRMLGRALAEPEETSTENHP